MASVSTPKRSNSTAQSSIHSPASNSSISSSSSEGSYYDFNIELDKTLSSSLWIEFMEWSDSMDVIALIMHQSTNDNQHLWLQRCVGKWENLLNIDLSQELTDPNTKIISLTWRYDGNGVLLGLANGEIIQFLIENGTANNKIIKSQIYSNAVHSMKWVNDKTDNAQTETNANNDNSAHNTDINDINDIIETNEALFSCTQLHSHDYPSHNNNTHKNDNHLLESLTFTDETNKFLSKIPCLPKPPRIDFRHTLDPKNKTLQNIMKQQRNKQTIPRKSQPNSLPILISNDKSEIKLHSYSLSKNNICIGSVNISQIKPSNTIIKQINEENENKLDLQNTNFDIKSADLCNNLQCINAIISTEKTNHLFLRFIHCPILHSRRNELLILSCHCEYIFVLLDQLSKLNRHLLSRWAMAFRCIKSKISPLQNNSEHWQHELKHNLLIGSPSQTFIQFVESTLNITALERGYKQFDQFINEISDIILRNLMHIITELIFRLCEIKGYSLWMERFKCLGINAKKVNAFIEKLKCLKLKLDQLLVLITDTKFNLIAFKDYLIFLAAKHNNEESQISFDTLNCKRIIACIDYDLEPNRVSVFLRDSLLPKKDLILFSLNQENKRKMSENDPLFKSVYEKVKKKWKRFERYSFSYLASDIDRSFKPIITVLANNISKSFQIENSNNYGLLYLSNGANIKKQRYVNNAINHKTDLAFITTDVFNELFGCDSDINLCVLNAKRTEVKTNKIHSKLVFIAIIHKTNNIQSQIVLSNDIWTEDFDTFEKLMSQFPVSASVNNIKICVIDIEPFSDETNDLDFDSMNIIQIKFVNHFRLAVLAKFGYNNQSPQRTCLFTVNLKKFEFEFEFQESLRLNDYEMSINEMVFDFGMTPIQININDLNKYLFGIDVDAYHLSMNGPRKLVAISCDPGFDKKKCNRLIVLDVNVEDESEECNSETDNDQETDSYDNEDSDLQKIVDID